MSSQANIGKTVSASQEGKTTFAKGVIEKIVGIAAREVPGVYALGKGLIGRTVAKVAGSDETSHGVTAEVGTREVAIDLELVAEYGVNLLAMAIEVREKIAERIPKMTGLAVKEVNIVIADIRSKDEEPPKHRVE